MYLGIFFELVFNCIGTLVQKARHAMVEKELYKNMFKVKYSNADFVNEADSDSKECVICLDSYE